MMQKTGDYTTKTQIAPSNAKKKIKSTWRFLVILVSWRLNSYLNFFYDCRSTRKNFKITNQKEI